ncbi:nickel-dependent lactate racemase [Pelosinus fermentans]|uniref:nickel-dependent lactate racemase n=1 Tax=Pelosinus fermentans TaxID=365349 RepID=UPI0002685FE0|nr:nickel-dependent lactate racemase [Pelosinus fermentans]EIW22826.1 Protein of unknown function DUF2088 [Pelosinus fermentans A11]
MLKEFSFGFGDSEIKVALPEERVVNVVEGKPAKAVLDVEAAVREVLNNPIGTPPLKNVIQQGDKVVIVASDITRQWVRHDLFLPTLLNELNKAGIPDEDISLIVALGAHRHHTHEENVLTFGQEIVKRIAILQSHAPETDDFVYVGQTSRGKDVHMNKHVVNADKVILTGGIVHHLMAGFGGGRKAIMPGISSYNTIQENHSLCLHAVVGQGLSPECTVGKLENNPMHADMLEMAELLKPAFLLNAVFTPEGQFASFVAGHWHEAWLQGCKTANEIFGVPISGKTDLVIASAGGFPKDINLYQGSKTIGNSFMAVKSTGVVILLLECRDIMEPPDFSGWFNYDSLYERELALRKGFTVPGFIALKLGYMAKEVPHIVVSLPQNKVFFEKAGMLTASSLDEAITMAEKIINKTEYTITVMAHGANTVPVESA